MYVRFREALGWYGVSAVILAYGLGTFSVIDVHGAAYMYLNITGAIGIGIEAWYKKDYQPVVLNIVWAGIALIALLRLSF